MGLIPDRLGPKLGLFLVGMFAVLGVATAALIIFGFERTRNDATQSSREGLEQEGQRTLLRFTTSQAAYAQSQMEATAGFAEQASSYFTNARANRPADPIPASALSTTAQGVHYDANPDRQSDVVVPPGSELTAAVLADVGSSAVLDDLFPTLLAGFGGQARSSNFEPISIYFQSVNNVARIYPRVPDIEDLPPVGDQLRASTLAVGPDENPQRATLWSPPYADVSGRGTVMSATVPVYDGSTFIGAMGVDFSLARLVAQIEGIKPTTNGFAFYMDEGGSLLPTTAQPRIEAELDDARNTEFAAVIQAVTDGRAEVGRAEVDGRDMFIAHVPLQGVGGTLALAAPVDEVTLQAAAVESTIEDGSRRTLFFALSGIALVFLLTLGVAGLLNRRLVLQPISEIVDGTRALAAGDLSQEIPVRSGDELGTLAASFNGMTGVLRERTDDLREREEQYRAVFEASSDGFVITRIDDGAVVDVNPAMCSMHGYTREEMLRLSPMQFIHEDDHHLFGDYMATVAAGGDYRCRARDVRKDGSLFHVDVMGTPVTYRGTRHILGMVRDITAQVETERILEERVEDRTSELAALLQVSQSVAAALDSKSVASAILTELAKVSDYAGATLAIVEGDDLVIVDSWGPFREEVVGGPTSRVPRSAIPVEFWDAMEQAAPLVVDDVRGDSVLAQTYRRVFRPFLELPSFAYIRSWIAVPLVRQGRIAGMLTASHGQAGHFTEENTRLILAAASQAAVAMENARLFEQTHERTGELQILVDVAQQLSSTIELDPLLAVVLDQVQKVAEYDRVSVLLADEEGTLQVHTTLRRAGDENLGAPPGAKFPRSTGPLFWATFERGQAVVIEDVRADTPLAAEYRSAAAPQTDATLAATRSWMGVPMLANDRLIGILALTSSVVSAYTERQGQLATAIASQAAVAIENARLFSEAEERTRELSTLLDVSRNVASTIELEPLLNLILDQVKVVAPFYRSAFMVLDGDDLEVVAVGTRQGAEDPSYVNQLGVRVQAVGSPIWQRMDAGTPFVIDDIHGDSPEAIGYRMAVGADADTTFANMRGWMGVPIMLKDRAIGMLALGSDQPNFYTEQHARLARAVTDQAAVAIENARLFEQTGHQHRESAALLQISNSLTSTLDLEQLVHVILEQLHSVVEYTGSSVTIVSGGQLEVLASRVLDPPNTPNIRGARFNLDQDSETWRAFRRLETVVISDIYDDTTFAKEYRGTVGRQTLQTPTFGSIRSWMAVPLAIKGEVIGMLSLSRNEIGYFTPEHTRVASAVGKQAALAIENARLYQHAAERTEELSTLLDVSSAVASTIELQPLLDVILEQIHRVASYDGATFFILHGDRLRAESFVTQDDPNIDLTTIGLEIPVAGSQLWDMASHGETMIIDDIYADTPTAAAFRAIAGPALKTRFQRIKSWLGIPLMRGGKPIGLLALSGHTQGVFDVTDARLARAVADRAALAIENARLFTEASDRTRELSALLDISKGIASTLDRGPLVGAILDQLKELVDNNGASIMLRNGDVLEIVDYDRSVPRNAASVQIPASFPIANMAPLWASMLAGDSVTVRDMQANDGARDVFRQAVGESLLTGALSHVRAMLAVPLIVHDDVIGTLTISNQVPGFFTEEHARVARAVADQAALALENARLYEETSRRARETEALLRADAELFRSLSLDDVFQALCDVAVDVLGVSKCMVTTIHDTTGRYTTRASRGVSQTALAQMARVRDRQPRVVLGSMTTPIVTPDARAALPEMAGIFEMEGIISTMDVPIRIEGQVRGDFALAYTRRHQPGADEQRLFQALADRAAIAIQNAELYERSQQVASLEERQRLARELHDSVSQALYGIALGARTARTQLDRDPVKAVEPVEYVLQLAEAGLAEMRALIFELRPESLQTEGLVAAIEKHVASTKARYGLEVNAQLGVEPDVRLDVKEALYRVTQEALHNIVKHAQARHVDVRLATAHGDITLEVSDDGRGFDPQGSYPGHVGLHSMRERVEKLHGTIGIESAPGAGSKVKVRIPLNGV